MKKAEAVAAPLERGALPWIVAVVAATTLPHFQHLPLWLSLLASGALLWRMALWRADAPLPARGWLAALAMATLVAIVWEFRATLGRDSGVALIVVLIALKPLEVRTRRDANVVVMLGFFLLLTHYFYSQSIATGLWLLACAFLLVATLLRLAGGAQEPATIARESGILLAQALPFMVVFFLFFPRVQGPLWGMPQDAQAGVTGLSDRLAPGSLNRVIESGAIAFRADFSGATPARDALYWRGPVFIDYDGNEWRARPAGQQPPSRPAIERGSTSFDYTITLEAHNLRWLLALDLPTSFAGAAFVSPSLELLSRQPVRNRSRYRVVSSTDALANRHESEAMLRQSLRLPAAGNPRARALAANWREASASPEAISGAALRHFGGEGFSYTLQPPLLGADPVDDFLFVTQSGFCEHFATAYVFLMRAAGVPARIVSGYLGGETNPIDGAFTVRQSDAHAWAEIWIADRGWLRVDPTAAVAPLRVAAGIEGALPARAGLPALLRADWLRDLRNRWEAGNNAWNQWILGYTVERQREVLRALGIDNPAWPALTALLALCSVALLGLATLGIVRQRQRVSAAQHAWQRFCQEIARRGVTRAPWEGPLAFAARVGSERPELGVVTGRAARLFAGVHYGRGGGDQVDDLKACVAELRRSRSWRRQV